METEKKNILLGVTGGIAAYKAAEICSAMVKAGVSVNVVMTKNATEFISAAVFESLSGRPAAVDTFDRNHTFEIGHISLSDQADLVLIAPATANVIAKLAHGIADDMLTTTVLACDCPKMIAPAMNTRMYENPVTQDNLKILKRYGWKIIDPASGRLACGTVGAGKLAPAEEIAGRALAEVLYPKDMRGMRMLVTAGPTREAIDPVRFLSNHSTGKMGYAIAEAAADRGAEVLLISGPTGLETPYGVTRQDVVSAQDMFEAVRDAAPEMDVIVKAAAVADYRPQTTAEDKIKKSEENMSLALERTQDILGWLGEHRREDQILCGFSMETRDMVENSRKKLEKKHLDLIAANNLKEAGAGFAVDTNRLTLISEDSETALPLLSKREAAHRLLDELLRIRKDKFRKN